MAGRASRTRRGVPHPAEPARGQLRHQAPDPVEHVVHPATRDLLHDHLDQFPGVERRPSGRLRGGPPGRGGAGGSDLRRVGTQKGQVAEGAVQLGEQSARPDPARRHLDAGQPLGREDHAQLAGERAQPVMAVRQHDDLPVVPRLEQLFRTAVHVSDRRLGRGDPVPVQGQAEPEHAVTGRVPESEIDQQPLRRGTSAASAHRRPGTRDRLRVALHHGPMVPRATDRHRSRSWAPASPQTRPYSTRALLVTRPEPTHRRLVSMITSVSSRFA